MAEPKFPGWNVMEGLPRAIPAYFAGVHFHANPVANANFYQVVKSPASPATVPNVPPASFGYGSTRLYNSGISHWFEVETSAGVYNWTNLDAAITYHRTAGRRVWFCLWGTPRFYCDNTTTNPYANNTSGSGGQTDYAAQGPYPSPYVQFGTGAYPGAAGGLTALGAFITALVTRYNDPAGVWRLANPTLGKGLIAIEGWNEPDQRGAYWWGTDAQLIDVEWTVTAAAKAVDSTILRLSVSSDTWANNLNRWMNQAGAINTGKTGKDCWDALSLHWYNYADAGVVDGDWSTQNGGYTFSPLSGANAPLTIRKLLAANGQNLNLWPLWFTECGIDYRDMPSAQMTDFLSRSTDSRYKHWMRMMMRAAAEGAQVFNSYAWEVSYSGYLCNDPSGTARAISDAHSYLAGRTMTSLRFMTSGPYTHWATFASGSDLIV